MDLKVGTVVAYPPHGVGRVAKREKRVILGSRGGGRRRRARERALRHAPDLARGGAAAAARDRGRPEEGAEGALREHGVVSDEIWSKRVQQAQEKLRSGDPLELAEIVRDGVRREQGKTTNGTPTKLSTSERALHLKARELLSGEISVTRGLDQAEADAWIDDQLAAAK